MRGLNALKWPQASWISMDCQGSIAQIWRAGNARLNPPAFLTKCCTRRLPLRSKAQAEISRPQINGCKN